MRRGRLGLSLATASWVTVLSGPALGNAEAGQPTAAAMRNGRVVVAGNTSGPGGKGGFAPLRPTTLQRAPQGTAQRLMETQASRAIRRELFRKHYQRPGQDYCKRNSHRPNCQR